MKYRVGFKVTCRCYVEVEADCIEDAMSIADEEMAEIDIGERAEDFEWECTCAEKTESLLEPVYGNKNPYYYKNEMGGMKMKVWIAVGQFGGVIQMMEVFSTISAAREYFKEFIERYGSVEDCDPDQYMDGNTEGAEEFFYWNDGFDADAEITIWPVDMEMES